MTAMLPLGHNAKLDEGLEGPLKEKYPDLFKKPE